MRMIDFARLTGITRRQLEQIGMRRVHDDLHGDLFRFMRALQYVQQTGLSLDEIRAYLYDENVEAWEPGEAAPPDSHALLVVHMRNLKCQLRRALMGTFGTWRTQIH